jgi:O-antigen ligase
MDGELGAHKWESFLQAGVAVSREAGLEPAAGEGNRVGAKMTLETGGGAGYQEFMDSARNSRAASTSPVGLHDPETVLARARPWLPLRAIDVQFYRASERLTEALIYVMVVFSPWAFGSTQDWAVWVMNVGGYVLGVLLCIRLLIRFLKGYRPPRWDGPVGSSLTDSETGWRGSPALITVALATLTLVLLGYVLVSALNARATYQRMELSLEYHACIPWLPHTHDSHRTWFAFWNYLGLACSFWAIWDWLQGKSLAEQRPEHHLTAHRSGTWSALPDRLRRLLWVLSLNGGVLAFEGIVQRLEGSGTLLWLVRPRINRSAEAQFGPYAYRANAAQYFNLLWPVCLGFWWTLSKSRGMGWGRHHLLLIGAVLMAASPTISTSRGGALVMWGIVVVAVAALLPTELLPSSRFKQARLARLTRAAALIMFFALALALGFSLGWDRLRPRMADLDFGFYNRQQVYEIGLNMARDYPVFGTGPGTFEPLYQFYRSSPDAVWLAELHDDWLETRITFGWFGCALIMLALATVGARWFVPGGIHGGRRLTVLLWLALAGLLAHARFDFPFQIHSIVFLFVVLCALLFSLSRVPNEHRSG